MPNWCSNIVDFKGEATQINEVKQLFEQLAQKERKERKGQLPDFCKENSGFLFEIRWDDGILYFETKWSPNIPIMRMVADQYDLTFTHDYFEPGNMVYGQADYTNGILTDIFLNDDDYDLFDYDEQSETYLFEGQEHESDAEILDTLLERKKAIAKL